MAIDDFVRNRWADAKEALRELDPDYVSTMETQLGMERAKSDNQPKNRLPKRWHELLEACFELTVTTRNYQTCYTGMSSEGVSGMSDSEAGKMFLYAFHTGLLYQHAVIEHTEKVVSYVLRIYGAREGTRNQLKKAHQHWAKLAKKRTKEGRNAIAHGGGLVSRGITEGQIWEPNVVLGIYPSVVLDHHYVNSGQDVRSGRYDQIAHRGPQDFLDEVARRLHDFEQGIGAPG